MRSFTRPILVAAGAVLVPATAGQAQTRATICGGLRVDYSEGNVIGRTDTRTWRDLNGDYTIYHPDGSVQFDELGPTSNVNFGKLIPTTTTIDRRTLDGFNAGNKITTDNTLITGADFTGPFCITAPSSPDLPAGGRLSGLRALRDHARGVHAAGRRVGGPAVHDRWAARVLTSARWPRMARRRWPGRALDAAVGL